jgi:hypothetical protein
MPGCQLSLSVPTPLSAANLLPTVFLLRAGQTRLAACYVNKMYKRWGTRIYGDIADWTEKLERVGLQVEEHVYYFSSWQAKWYCVLAMRPFQLF